MQLLLHYILFFPIDELLTLNSKFLTHISLSSFCHLHKFNVYTLISCPHAAVDINFK